MADNYREYRTQAEMREHGWIVEPATAICKKCGGEINWATSRNAKKLPLDCNSTTPHFKTCSNGGAPPLPPQSRSNSGKSDTVPLSQTPTPIAKSPALAEMAALREAIQDCAVAVRSLFALLGARKSAVTRANPISDEDIPF